jgi:hypothetical protein
VATDGREVRPGVGEGLGGRQRRGHGRGGQPGARGHAGDMARRRGEGQCTMTEGGVVADDVARVQRGVNECQQGSDNGGSFVSI